MKAQLIKALPFIETADHRPRPRDLESDTLRSRFAPPPTQLDFFATRDESVITGEL
jgi:hypothetical protein